MQKFLGVGAIALTAAVLYIRLFIGVDTTDESQYLAQSWLYFVGGKPLVHDLFLQQMAQWPILPICSLYSTLFGYEAIALLLRHLYWLLMAVSAFFWCRALTQWRPSLESYIVAALFLAFIPFSIPSWSYNTVTQSLLPLSMLLLLRAPSSSHLWAFIGGLCAAVVCFSYPTMVAISALFFVTVVAVGKVHTSRAIWYLAGGIVTTGLLSVWFLVFGIDNLDRAFSFTGHFGGLGGIAKLKMVWWQLTAGLPNLSLGIFGTIVALLLFDKRQRSLPLMSAGLILLVLSLGTNELTRQRAHGIIVYMTIALLFVVPLVRFRLGGTKLPSDLLIIQTFSILTGLLMGYTSSNGLINCAIGWTPALAILLLQLCSLLDTTRQKRGGHLFGRALVCFLLLVSISYSSFTHVYGAPPISGAYVRVSRGPFKGLLTAPWKAEMVDQFQGDIEALSQRYKTIFASYFAPAYFSAQLAPVTAMLNIHPMEFTKPVEREILSPTLVDGQYPDIVVTAKFLKPGIPYQFEDFFLSTGRYELAYDRPFYRIFTIKDGAPSQTSSPIKVDQ